MHTPDVLRRFARTNEEGKVWVEVLVPDRVNSRKCTAFPTIVPVWFWC